MPKPFNKSRWRQGFVNGLCGCDAATPRHIAPPTGHGIKTRDSFPQFSPPSVLGGGLCKFLHARFNRFYMVIIYDNLAYWDHAFPFQVLAEAS